MWAQAGISHTPKHPIVFALLFGCEKNAESGSRGGEFQSCRLSLPDPEMHGVGWSSSPGCWHREWEMLHSLPALWVAAEAMLMPGFEGSESTKKVGFFNCLGFFFTCASTSFLSAFGVLTEEYRVWLIIVARKSPEISQKCCSNLCIPLTTQFSVKLSSFSLFVSITIAGFTSWVTESAEMLTLILPLTLPRAIFFCNENNNAWERSLGFLFCFLLFSLVLF